MKNREFLDFFPQKVLEKFYEKTYLPYETISYVEDNTCFFILKGKVGGVREKKNDTNYFPKVFKRPEFCGFNNYILEHAVHWEFIALTDVRVLIIPTEIVEEVILKDVGLYSRLVKIQSKILEYGMKFYYLKACKGNEAAYAYFLSENTDDNGTFTYIKHNRFCEMLNMGRSSFHTLEKKFIEGGIIKKVCKTITILNYEKLEEFYREFISI